MKTLHSIRASMAAIVLAAGVLGASVLPTFADSPVPTADPAAPATCAGFATTTTLNQHFRPVTAGAPLTISGVVTARYYGLSAELGCIDMCTRSWNHYLSSLRQPRGWPRKPVREPRG